MNQQEESIKKLGKQGFREVNSFPYHPDANGNPMDESEGYVIVMVRRPNRFTREYRQVDPDGTIN